MKFAAPYIGWVAAAVFLITTFYFYQQNSELEVLLEEAADEQEKVLDRVEEQGERNHELALTIERLDVQLEETRRVMFRLEDMTYDLNRRSNPFTSLIDLFVDSVAGALGITIGEGNIVGAVTEAVDQIISEDLTGAAAEASVDARYGKFLAGLNLDPDREAEVRAAFVQGIKAQLEQTYETMKGDESVDDGSTEDVLTTHLAEVLSADELTQFEAYQESSRDEQTRRSFEVQLSMFADELTEESQAQIVDVLVEEMDMILQRIGADSTDGLEVEEKLAVQKEVYERALGRLRGELGDEQYQIFLNYVERQNRVLEAGGNLIQRFFRRDISSEEEN